VTGRTRVTLAAVLLTAAVIATACSGDGSAHLGGPLVAATPDNHLFPNPGRQMIVGTSRLKNTGKRSLVLDGVRLVQATPGLSLINAWVAYHYTGSYGVMEDHPEWPAAAGTAIRPGKSFSVELRLRFTGQPDRWTYRALEVRYHVGRAHYERTANVDNIICRTQRCYEEQSATS